MAALQNVQKIQIELDGNPPFEYIAVKQGEAGSRVAEITLLENKKEFSIPSGTTAKIKFYKPDGKPVLNAAEIKGNVIRVTYTEQMLAAPGTGRGEIALYNGENILRTATFYTKITPTVYAENGLISDCEFLELAKSITKMDQATEKAINATASVENAVAEAKSAATAANSAASTVTEAKNAAATAATNAQAAANSANTNAAAASEAAEKANKAATAYVEIEKNLSEFKSEVEETTNSLKQAITNNMDTNGLVINSFDGEFQNGYYSSSDGTFMSGGDSDNEVCIKNKIRCAENDVITVTFPVEISSSRCLIYDSSNTLIFTKYFGDDGGSVTGVKKYKITVPQGGMWFAFNATKNKNVIDGTTVYINQINVVDSIRKNAADIQKNATDIQKNATDIQNMQSVLTNTMDTNGLVINSFDGEFQNGYYSSSNGTFISANSDNEVCIKNKIRCAENDVITVTFPVEISSSRCLIYDSSNTLIFTKYFGNDGGSVTGVKKYKITVPQGGMWFTFNATKNKNVIDGTTVYINQINVVDSIQKNATDIQKNAADIQKNAADMVNMQSVIVNDKRNFIRLTTIKSAKLMSITNISKYPSRIEITGKNILNILTKIDQKIKNDSGIEISDASFYYNQYIPVTPKERIYINFGVQRIYQYDANIAWLRRTQIRDENKIFGEYIIPDDCYFIQAQTYRSAINLDKAMIVRFTENLDYEEYKYYAVNIQNENELPLSITVYSENTTIYCGENVEAAVKYNGLTGITIPACKTYDLWEPSEATDDYKSGIGMENTKISLSISDFLGDYYDVYLGNHNGYKVIKRSLGRDESNDYELLEYQFIPKHYNRTVLLSSGMNANELSPMFGLAYLIKAIMDGTNDPGINYLRENVRLVVLPSINPWGFDQNPMNYYNSNHVRINKNFDYNGSWKLMPSNEYPGAAADSEAETKILKCWINQYANQAELWIDCHSDAFGNSPHLHQVITSSSDVGTIIGKVQQKITDYYVEKGYIADGTIDAVKPSWWTSPLTNYPKTVYSEKICGIKALMIEQYVNGTFYGSDGKYNNDSYDIKNYTLMLRAFILAILESDEKTIDVNDIYWMAYHKVIN